MDDPRNRGSEAVHHRKRQTEKVAVWHGGHGSHSGGSGGNYDYFCSLRKGNTMKFKTLGNRNDPAVLFFHAMGVTGESSEPVAEYLQDRYFCILPRNLMLLSSGVGLVGVVVMVWMWRRLE